MKRILVTSDWHLSANPRDYYRHEFQPTLLALIDRYEVDELIVLGDITEAKGEHSAWLVNRVAKYVSNLADKCHVTIVRGNHDGYTPDEPFFAFLNHQPEVWWINGVSHSGSLLFLAHTTDYQRDWADIDWDIYQWVFTHNTFKGTEIGPGQTLDGIPVEALHGIPTISGDVHIPQKISGPVYYTGAPYTVDFGDNYQPRVLLINDGSLKSIRVSGRQKRLVEVRSVEGLAKVKGANPGDILKVRVQLSPADHARWPEMQKAVRQWGVDNGYQVHTVVPLVVEGQRHTMTERKTRPQQDDKTLVTEYAKVRGIAAPTVQVGLELIEEV